MPSDIQLAACPFCGVQPEEEACDRLISIGCKPCGYRRTFKGLLSIQPSPVRVSDLEFYHQHAGDEARQAWNVRAAP